jgi:Kef-type K+ transport system membrane component KefB
VELSIGSLAVIMGTALGFLVGAIGIGTFLVPKIMSLMARLRTHGVMIIAATVFCFIISYLAGISGLAPIVGAFAAGLILEKVHFKDFNEKHELEDLLSPVTSIFVPVFFVMMGIQVRLETFLHVEVLGIALALTLAAIIGKQVCGLVVSKGYDRLTIGLGMIPRGEVGLIFAGIGKSLKVVDDAIFSAVVIMVVLTTLLTPPLLKFSLQRHDKARR